MMPELTQDEIRQRLAMELARVSGGSSGPAREQGGLVNLDKDDRAHNFAARERRLALKDLDAQKVTQIEAALERLEEGR
jgi:RNA polymerase-binding transcription factor DksA